MSVPEPTTPATNPNRWIYAHNLIVLCIEQSKRFEKLMVDWRIYFQPDLRDPAWHRVLAVAIARSPDDWTEPSLAQGFGYTVEENEALNTPGNETQFLELVGARIEVGFRSLVKLMLERNPERKDRVLGYL
jgi:hypothetical protein